jgi:HK97 family phage portal protein
MFISQVRADAGGDSDRSPFGNWWFTPVGGRSSSGARVNAASALAIPAVFAAVRVLSESFACMPFDLFRLSAKGDNRSKVRDHWIYRLIAKRPNKWQAPYEWRLMLQGHLALRGNAYCQITADRSGRIIELLPLHPDRMTVEMLEGNNYRYCYVDQKGNQLRYTRGEIWHLRGLSDDGIMGLSPIECEREALGEALAMQAYSSRFFANDAKPGGGWIEYPGKFRDAETKKTFRDSWQQLQGGSNRGKVAVLESGMKFHELGLKNSDAQFIEARAYKVTDIARIFRVPPHKIGDLARATFSNIEQQSIEFWTDTMLPYAELWESSIEFNLLGQGLGGLDEDLEPEFDMDRMMRGDSTARSAYYASRTQWGSMTPNQVRKHEGEDELPWLNFTMRPVNMVKMDANGEEGPEVQKLPGESDPQEAKRTDRRERAQTVGKASTARLRMLLEGNANRLARRASGALLRKPAAEVFGDDFAALVTESLGVDRDRANSWCAKLKALPSPTEQSIGRGLVACATGA